MKAYFGVVAGVVLAVGSAAAISGCSDHPSEYEVRQDPSSLVKGDTGLQSKDLITMTDDMGAKIIQIPEIAQNPYKVVIVMTAIENRTTVPSEDLTIYLARIRANLNKFARDKVAFVEKRAVTANLQATEGAANTDPFEEGSRGAGPQQPGPMTAQYALKGVFYDKPNNVTNFHYCTFQLTNMRTGEIVWEGDYEVRTLR